MNYYPEIENPYHSKYAIIKIVVEIVEMLWTDIKQWIKRKVNYPVTYNSSIKNFWVLYTVSKLQAC